MATRIGDTGGSGRGAGLYREVSRPSAASRSRGDRAAGEDERLKPLR